DQARATEVLAKVHLEGVVVGIECRLDPVKGTEALEWADGVDPRRVRSGEHRKAVSLVQPGSERRAGVGLIHIDDAQKVRALGAEAALCQRGPPRKLL